MLCTYVSAFVGVSIGVITLAFCSPEQKSIAIVSLIATLTLNGFAAAGFIVGLFFFFIIFSFTLLFV